MDENTSPGRQPATGPTPPPTTIAELAVAVPWFDGEIPPAAGGPAVVQDNSRRAGNAANALVHHAIATRKWSPADRIDTDVPSSLADLIAGLRHLCDAIGLDHRQIVAAGYRRYIAELHGRRS